MTGRQIAGHAVCRPGRMYTSPFTSQLTGEKSDTDQSCCPDLPGPDSRPAELLGGTRLRNPAALRHGGGCRDVPYRHLPALDRPGNLERGLCPAQPPSGRRDRKSTRLNSSHVRISYAVFCLKKKNNDPSLLQ